MGFLKSDFMLNYGWLIRLPLAFAGGYYLIDGGLRTVFGVVALVIVFSWLYFEYKVALSKNLLGE